MEEYNAYVGLDIHKNTIAVAIADAGRNGECRSYGTIGYTAEQLRTLADKLTQRHGAVHFVYEAGPTGYVPCRTLIEAGYDCAVTGPAQIPKKPGDRVKTDRRDALQLARLDRAGELDAIWVPGEHHEAIRDLVRAREQAVQDLRRARQRVSSFLLRHGRSYAAPTMKRTGPRRIGVGWPVYSSTSPPTRSFWTRCCRPSTKRASAAICSAGKSRTRSQPGRWRRSSKR